MNIVNIHPTISVIIPVYNTEKYLRRCLDSIVAQTYKEFECILVDDGSTDGSGKICDEYAVKDNRFHVIHKENGGVATARQAGTDAAIGEYIIHADPDDWTEPEMLEQMYAKAKETDADVTICDFFYTNELGEDTLVNQKPYSFKPHDVLMEMFGRHRIHGALWNKLTKRSCYLDYNLSFYPGVNFCEDVLIWAQLFQNPNIKISYLPKAFYHYYQSETSITHSHSPKVIATMKKYFVKLEDTLPDTDKYIAKIESANFYFWLWHINICTKDEFIGKKFTDKEIKHINRRKRDKIACVLLNHGFERMAKFILSLEKPKII